MAVYSIIDDCEWAVEKAKEHLKQNDKHGARAWMMTAQSLFPYRFIVQYETFQLRLVCEEYQAAAQSLIELCTRFAKEETLQTLVLKIIPTLSSINGRGQVDKDVQKLKEVYKLLPPLSQKKLLLTITDSINDILEKGKLSIVILKLFPETVLSLGLDMYDLLSQSFSRPTIPMADNSHRELLVTELIPLLASSPRVTIEQPILRSSGQTMVLKTSHICQWLEVTASFYTSVTIQELVLRKAHPFAGKSGWERLHQIFLSVCDKCGWIEVLHNKQIGPRLPSKVRWIGLKYISGYNPLRIGFEVPRGVAIACFYISVFLFFESAWTYYSHVHQITTEGGSKCWALIEETSSTVKQLDVTNEKPPAKKRKLEENNSDNLTINLQTGDTKSMDSSILESFIVATECWSFLQSSNTYRGEFSRLCQQWSATEWSWMSVFRIDMSLYKGDHELYRKLLQAERLKIKTEELSNVENIRTLIQLINAYLILGDSKSACNLATELLSIVPEGTDVGPVKPVLSKIENGRSLKLIGCLATDIVPYTLDIILNAVKEMVFSDSCTDIAIGQLMILAQYNWPKEMELFKSVVTLIQTRGCFSYDKFFDYIITIQMLEEIMYFINQGNIKIDIFSTDTKIAQAKVTTRGLNNKVKEELLTLMYAQLARCGENVDGIIRKFFRNEKLCFVIK